VRFIANPPWRDEFVTIVTATGFVARIERKKQWSLAPRF
jgi:hypothetical protein